MSRLSPTEKPQSVQYWLRIVTLGFCLCVILVWLFGIFAFLAAAWWFNHPISWSLGSAICTLTTSLFGLCKISLCWLFKQEKPSRVNSLLQNVNYHLHSEAETKIVVDRDF